MRQILPWLSQGQPVPTPVLSSTDPVEEALEALEADATAIKEENAVLKAENARLHKKLNDIAGELKAE